jgi:hypothetical protein
VRGVFVCVIVFVVRFVCMFVLSSYRNLADGPWTRPFILIPDCEAPPHVDSHLQYLGGAVRGRNEDTRRERQRVGWREGGAEGGSEEGLCSTGAMLAIALIHFSERPREA